MKYRYFLISLQKNMMLNMGKRTLCLMPTAKVLMRVCIHTVWSGHSLFVDIYYNIHWFCKWAMKVLISLQKCAGWVGPVLPTKCIRALFMHCASCVYSEASSWGVSNEYPWFCGEIRKTLNIFVLTLLLCGTVLGRFHYCRLESPYNFFLIFCRLFDIFYE